MSAAKRFTATSRRGAANISRPPGDASPFQTTKKGRQNDKKAGPFWTGLSAAARGGRLEREQDIENLLSVPGLLHVGELPTSAVRNPCFRNLRVVDGIGRGDVLGPHHAGDEELADFKVHADFLPALNDEITVGQDLRDDHRDRQTQFFLAVDGSDALARVARAQADDACRIDRLGEDAAKLTLEAEQVGQIGVVDVGARPRRRIVERGLVVDADDDGQNVSYARGALVLEEGARALTPQLIGHVGHRRGRRHR